MWDELLCDASTWFTASCGPKQEAKGLCPWGQVLREACLSPSQVVIPVVSVQMIKNTRWHGSFPMAWPSPPTPARRSVSFWASAPLSQPRSPQPGSGTLPSLSSFHPFLCSVFQYVFVSLLSRDSVYDMLRRVCTHLQVWNLGAGGLGRLLRPALRSRGTAGRAGWPVSPAHGTGAGTGE